MKSVGILQGLAVCLAGLGFCLPAAALAEVQTGRTPVIHDVALNDGGVLLGQVVDVQGAGQASKKVSLRLSEREVAEAKTDANGYFAFRGIRGGVYELMAADGVGAYRLWAPGTAPPKAQPGAMVVAGQDLVRGQYCGPTCPPTGRLKFWLTNPWVVAGIVATAVAVPVGIHNADHGGGPSSP